MHQRLLALVAVAVLLVACVPQGSASGPGAASAAPTLAPATPTASPEFYPGPASLSGRVARLTPGGVVINSAGREVDVDLTHVLDVWKETVVPATAIAAGDDLFVNGTDGSPFVARHVWAHIGRIDGVVQAIDPTGIVVEARGASGQHLERIDFSAYLEYGAPDGSVKMTRADLVVGRTIGAVVYRLRSVHCEQRGSGSDVSRASSDEAEHLEPLRTAVSPDAFSDSCCASALSVA